MICAGGYGLHCLVDWLLPACLPGLFACLSARLHEGLAALACRSDAPLPMYVQSRLADFSKGPRGRRPNPPWPWVLLLQRRGTGALFPVAHTGVVCRFHREHVQPLCFSRALRRCCARVSRLYGVFFASSRPAMLIRAHREHATWYMMLSRQLGVPQRRRWRDDGETKAGEAAPP